MPTIFNSNTLHNVLNIVIAVLAAVTAFLVATGCTVVVVTGNLECSQSWISPSYTAGAIAVLSLTKTAINIGRDGISGLIKAQPPVQK